MLIKHLKTFLILLLLSAAVYSADAERPKIGLVLSGGGARGFAHIGTLKMLDSLQIPIDFIAGTSMGGIAAALYSIGYSGYDQEKMIYNTDWDEIFTDTPPRTELPYFQRKETGKYQLSFGLKGLKPVPPSGLIYGQKVSLLFSSLTFPYEKITDFDQLPIPFRCVAVDLVTGNQVVLKNGSLSKAMRAAMAIPSVFSPVQWGDSLLIDGGFANNLPIDVVKEMGADFVIAVDVESPLKKHAQLKSALDVLQQSINMMGLEQRRKNEQLADIHIRPEVSDFSPGDFNRSKINAIVKRGIAAANKNLGILKDLKRKHDLFLFNDSTGSSAASKFKVIHDVQITGYTTIPFKQIYEGLGFKPGDTLNIKQLNDKIAEIKTSGFCENLRYELIPLSEKFVRIVFRVKEKENPIIFRIVIEGQETLPFTFIYRLLGLNPGIPLDTKLLNRRIMEMYGLGYFEHILYEIEPVRKNRVILKITVKELPERKLHIGLRYDDYHKLVAAISIKGTSMFMPGLRFEYEFQFAGLTKFRSKYYYPSRALDLPVYPFINYGFKDIPIDIFDSTTGRRIAQYADRSAHFGLGLGLLLSKSLNAEVEYQHEYMNIRPDISFSDPELFPTWNHRLRKLQACFTLDLLDDVLLPRNGILIKGNFEGSYKELNSDLEYSVISASADIYRTFFYKHTIRAFAFRGICKNAPVYKFHNPGKPEYFVGLEYGQLFGSQITILRCEYRYQFSKDIYFKLMANSAFDLKYHIPDDYVVPNDAFGYGIGIKVLSPVGPLEVIYGRGDKVFLGPRKHQDMVYFIMGYKF